jgi:hypothetical protein
MDESEADDPEAATRGRGRSDQSPGSEVRAGHAGRMTLIFD